jgi:hypothetical protein
MTTLTKGMYTIHQSAEISNGLFASLAYNYLVSKDVNSIEAEIQGCICFLILH